MAKTLYDLALDYLNQGLPDINQAPRNISQGTTTNPIDYFNLPTANILPSPGGDGITDIPNNIINTPNGNTDFEQNLLDQGIGLQGAVGDPVVALGEMPVTQNQMDEFNAGLTADQGGGVGGSYDEEVGINTPINFTVPNSTYDEAGLDIGDGSTYDEAGVIPPTQTYYDGNATLQDAGAGQGGMQLAEVGLGGEADFTPPSTYDAAGLDIVENNPYGTNPNTGNPYTEPRTIADQNAVLGQTNETNNILNNAKNLGIAGLDNTIEIGGKSIDIGKSLAGAALSSMAGIPGVGLALNALPERDQRQNELDNLYDVENGTIQSGLMQGYNPVSGNPLDPNFGLQDAYQDRIDTIENTLQDKYEMTDQEIADVKAGSYKGTVDTDLLDRLNQLEIDKEKEAGILNLYEGDINPEGTGDGSIAEKIEENNRLGIPDDIGVEGEDPDRFDNTPPIDIMPQSDFTVPDSTYDEEIFNQPQEDFTVPDSTYDEEINYGDGTGLEGSYDNAGINSIPESLESITPQSDFTVPDSTYDQEIFNNPETGVELDPVNPNERASIVDRAKEIGLGDVETHLANNSKLEKAAQAGIIDKELYNELGGYDVTQNITGGSEIPSAALNAIVGTGRNIGQAILGEQDFAGIPATTINNTQGALEIISQDKKNIHNAIVNGDPYTDEGIAAIENQIEMSQYEDPIMGMVNQNPLANPNINNGGLEDILGNIDLQSPDAPSTPVDDYDFSDFDEGDTSVAADVPTGSDPINSFFNTVDEDRGRAQDDSPPASTTPTNVSNDSYEDQSYSAPSQPAYQGGTTQRPGSGGGGGDSGGSSSGGGGKIVCTMMNESYGFGSFRNKIWMKFHKNLSPEYQKGYHKIFLPLIKIAKTNKVVKKVLEHIAVHSTIDMRQATRGKTHLLGRVYRKIILPLCYWVGKHG